MRRVVQNPQFQCCLGRYITHMLFFCEDWDPFQHHAGVCLKKNITCFGIYASNKSFGKKTCHPPVFGDFRYQKTNPGMTSQLLHPGIQPLDLRITKVPPVP